MSSALILMFIYRALALGVAGMMVVVILKERDWKVQIYSALVFVPFVLRGLGVK